MKQHSKVKSSAYAHTTTDHTSQDLLYTNMSNHYRRLLNAKKRVDTNPPKMYRTYGKSSPHRSKKGGSNLEGLTPSDLLLIQQVEQETGYWEPNPPGQQPNCPGKGMCPGKAKCPAVSRGHRRQRSSSLKKPFHDTTIKPTPSKQQKVKEEKVDRHLDCFLPGSRHFVPLILKTTASSKIRVSDSYHPPRRKNSKEKPSKEMDSCDEYDLGENEVYVQTWENPQVIELVQCDGVNKPCPMKYNGQWVIEKSQSNKKPATTDPSSKVSTGSRDSAYNGGTSSGAESRGPTPEQIRRVPPIFGKCSTPDSGMGKKAANAPGCPAACNNSPSPAGSKTRPATSNLASATANQPNGNDDVLYATFSHEITTEILKKGIYTDKGINGVIYRHIELNKLNLAMDKLQKEADNIRTQLGIQNEEGVQKHLQFAEEPQWKSEPRRSISNELTHNAGLNSNAKEMEANGSNNNLLDSSPKQSHSSESHEGKLKEEDVFTSTSGKLDSMKSSSRALEDANSVSYTLKDVYYSSSGKLVNKNGESDDSLNSGNDHLKIFKSNSGINEYSSASAVVSPPASSMDGLEAQHIQLKVPKIAAKRSTSLPLPTAGGKLFVDASIEVKPSTNSIETQTDITAM